MNHILPKIKFQENFQNCSIVVVSNTHKTKKKKKTGNLQIKLIYTRVTHIDTKCHTLLSLDNVMYKILHFPIFQP
jgi:hypothetical protein